MKLHEWQKTLLKQGELYRVGGAVRDELMGLAPSGEDVDYLVRGVSPTQLEKSLERFGRVVFVGKSFGVYKFRPDGERFDCDIAFPRKEVSTGTGHREFDVDCDENLPVETDLARRDFTINAIAQNLGNRQIIDPFGGREDIERRRLRMIFAEAFREDPLRILRGIRFAARFELDVASDTAEAMEASVPMLASVSAERVQDELDKILTQCDRPSDAFAMMHTMGALAVVLPELDRGVGVEQNEHHPDDVFWHSVKSCDAVSKGNRLLRWAALLHDIGKVDAKKTVSVEKGETRTVFYGHEKTSAAMANDILHRFRHSNDFIKKCVHLIRHHMYHYQSEWNGAAVRRFMQNVGENNLDDMLDLKRADVLSRGRVDRLVEIDELAGRVREERAARIALKIQDLAIDGKDVMSALDITEGSRVGEVLRDVFERVIEDPSLNERAVLLELLATYEDAG